MTESDGTPTPKERPPLLFRLTFYAGLLVFAFLLVIGTLNSQSMFPSVDFDTELGSRQAKSDTNVREVWIDGEDGRLYGWEYGSDSAPNKFLMFSGNATQVGAYMGRYREVAKNLDAQILHVDYRGFGGSEGRPTELGVYADARSAWEYATTQLGWERPMLWGWSLGGAVAVRLAFDLRDAKAGPAALVLESTFTSARDLATAHYPWFVIEEWLCWHRFDSAACASELALPVLQFHGADDQVVPVEVGKDLASAFASEDKKLVEFDDCGHNNVWADEKRRATIAHETQEFLDRIKDGS